MCDRALTRRNGGKGRITAGYSSAEQGVESRAALPCLIIVWISAQPVSLREDLRDILDGQNDLAQDKCEQVVMPGIMYKEEKDLPSVFSENRP